MSEVNGMLNELQNQITLLSIRSAEKAGFISTLQAANQKLLKEKEELKTQLDQIKKSVEAKLQNEE